MLIARPRYGSQEQHGLGWNDHSRLQDASRTGLSPPSFDRFSNYGPIERNTSRLHFGGEMVGKVAIVASAAKDIDQRRAALDHALAARDGAICKAFAEGWPIGAIAEAAKLTSAQAAASSVTPQQRVERPSRTPRTK